MRIRNNRVATVAIGATVLVALGSAGGAVAPQDTGPAVGDATTRADEGFDWGWLGLLGLIGLAGLTGSRRRHE